MTMIMLGGALAVATLAIGLLLLRQPAPTGILGGSLVTIGGAVLTTLSFDYRYVGLWDHPLLAVITLFLGAVLAVLGAVTALLKWRVWRQQRQELAQLVAQLEPEAA